MAYTTAPLSGVGRSVEASDSCPAEEFGIASRRLQDGIVLSVHGEVDLATAGRVERELRRAEERYDLVALDLSETSFMDSTGLHVIIAASRRLRSRGGRLLVVEGAPQVRQLFELTQLAQHLDLVQDVAELEHAVRPGRPEE